MDRPTANKPHLIDGRAVTTEEIAPLVSQHAMHAGIAYFPGCPGCETDKRRPA
jgi:hypothetical protein